MVYIVQHFFGATSMGATSGCSVTAWRSTESCKRIVEAAAQRTATPVASRSLRLSEARECEVRRTQDPGWEHPCTMLVRTARGKRVSVPLA